MHRTAPRILKEGEEPTTPIYSNWAKYVADPLNVHPAPMGDAESSNDQPPAPTTCRPRSSLVESDYQISDEEQNEEEDAVDQSFN